MSLRRHAIRRREMPVKPWRNRAFTRSPGAAASYTYARRRRAPRTGAVCSKDPAVQWHGNCSGRSGRRCIRNDSIVCSYHASGTTGCGRASLPSSPPRPPGPTPPRRPYHAVVPLFVLFFSADFEAQPDPRVPRRGVPPRDVHGGRQHARGEEHDFGRLKRTRAACFRFAPTHESNSCEGDFSRVPSRLRRLEVIAATCLPSGGAKLATAVRWHCFHCPFHTRRMPPRSSMLHLSPLLNCSCARKTLHR